MNTRLKGQLVLFLSGCASVPFYIINSNILYEISLLLDPIAHAFIYNIHVYFVCLLYIFGKQLMSCRDGQLT